MAWHQSSLSTTQWPELCTAIPICTLHQITSCIGQAGLPTFSQRPSGADFFNAFSFIARRRGALPRGRMSCAVFLRTYVVHILFSMKWVEMKGSAEASSENVRFDGWWKLHVISVGRRRRPARNDNSKHRPAREKRKKGKGKREKRRKPEGGRNIRMKPSDHGDHASWGSWIMGIMDDAMPRIR